VSEEKQVVDESEEWADGDEDLDEEGQPKGRSKKRKRRLVYDERLGEVVARKRHKRNRDWEDWEDEEIY